MEDTLYICKCSFCLGTTTLRKIKCYEKHLFIPFLLQVRQNILYTSNRTAFLKNKTGSFRVHTTTCPMLTYLSNSFLTFSSFRFCYKVRREWHISAVFCYMISDSKKDKTIISSIYEIQNRIVSPCRKKKEGSRE